MESSSSAQAGEANSPDLTDLSDLESWGRDNLDLKLLRGSKIKLPVQTNFEKNRAGYIQKCPFKGTLILECRGAEMVVWAPLAMHTSLAAREYVERLVAPDCTHTELRVPCHDVEPYILDRTAAFWATGCLYVVKKKAVAYATKLPSNTSEANVSDEMTTTCVLLKILNMASNVRDDHLKEAALARLCSHVTAGQMGHREYVINLEFIYRADDHTAYVQEIRKILLPALLNLSAAICASPLREDYFKLMSTHPKLNHDHRMAVYYRKYVLGEGQEEEEED